MRYKLKCGGKPRRKAVFGADGAIMAAATLAASAANVAAQNKAASTQAKAIENNAKNQAQAIQKQTDNNNQLQEEYIQFSKEQNKMLRDQQQEMQTTLQQLAGQQNMNSRLDAGKVILRNGGIGNRRRLSNIFYGGANQLFRVTDGGGVLPIQVNNNGYGLYEIIGNDHEHYHKTKGGKHKTGVGIKFNDGSVVEGEGNQNTNQGELLYVTPQDAMFISKHSINGFNPTKAVQQGMHPEQAFNIQQNIKNMNGITDDGSKLPRRRSIASKGDWVDLVNSLTTRKGIARGIREFGQGIPFLNGALDNVADYVEGSDKQPIYGIDANGNQHFIGYTSTNNNENALFSLLGGRASQISRPIRQKYLGKVLNNVGRILRQDASTERGRALNQTARILRQDASTERGRALNNSKTILSNDASSNNSNKTIIDKLKNGFSSTKSFISNNKKTIGLIGGGTGTIGLGSYLASKMVNLNNTPNINNIPINTNSKHPYIDSYKQNQQIQQSNINSIDSIKNDTTRRDSVRQDTTRNKPIIQAKQSTNVVSQKQVTTQQAKQDAINNNTSKTYKNFNEAFDAAIARGDKTFTFGGLEYAAKKAKGDDSRNRRWGVRRTEQVMAKYKSWKDYLERSDKRKMKYGGRIKADNGTYWDKYGGATINGAGDMVGAGLSTIGGIIAGNKIAKANQKAANYIIKSYQDMHGINPSIISRNDFNTGHAMAAIQSADTNVNPVLERIRRNASAESNIINRGTLSSAARQQRLAGINDRMLQRYSEAYANKHNQDQQIIQDNMQRIQQASTTNAQLDSQAMQNYNQLRAQIAMYNNDIENNKIAGIGQAQADAITNSATIKGNALQQGLSALGSGIASAAGGFANAWQANREYKNNFNNAMLSAEPSGLTNYAIYNNNRELAQSLYDEYVDSDNPMLQRYANALNNKFGFTNNLLKYKPNYTKDKLIVPSFGDTINTDSKLRFTLKY